MHGAHQMESFMAVVSCEASDESAGRVAKEANTEESWPFLIESLRNRVDSGTCTKM